MRQETVSDETIFDLEAQGAALIVPQPRFTVILETNFEWQTPCTQKSEYFDQ